MPCLIGHGLTSLARVTRSVCDRAIPALTREKNVLLHTVQLPYSRWCRWWPAVGLPNVWSGRVEASGVQREREQGGVVKGESTLGQGETKGTGELQKKPIVQEDASDRGLREGTKGGAFFRVEILKKVMKRVACFWRKGEVSNISLNGGLLGREGKVKKALATRRHVRRRGEDKNGGPSNL